VLEERGFELLLVNARHVKILPGRKTDVADAAWLAELLEHGLLRGSFVPPPAIRQLRDLTRYRKRLIQAHTAETQRVHKTLEDAGIKLDSVAADVLGVWGRAMLAALVGGERDPAVLAELARGRLRSKLPQLRQALQGRFGEHHALLVRLSLEHREHLERAIAQLDQRVDQVIAPFAAARDRLGDHHRGRQARRGDDHRRDRRRHGRLPHRRAPGVVGGPPPWQQRHRRQAPLGQAHAGQPLARRGADRVRLGGRPQPGYLIWPPSSGGWPDASASRKAAGAVGHSILVIAWQLLANGCDYHDLGGDWFARRSDHDRHKTHLVKQLQALGYSVTLQPAA
jgi:transposase